MYYIIGDIHGCLSKLTSLYSQILPELKDDDTLIFLGDYIDRGDHSFEVVEFLITLPEYRKSVFLKGNHESMFMKFIAGEDIKRLYYYNGGDKTVAGYTRRFGYLNVPKSHREFFSALNPYYETEEFVAVHAGLNPKIYSIDMQDEEELIWIREKFFRSPGRWEKTVIFGHTPTAYLTGGGFEVYHDRVHNIIGIDTGAVYGGVLTCLRWPDLKEYRA